MAAWKHKRLPRLIDVIKFFENYFQSFSIKSTSLIWNFRISEIPDALMTRKPTNFYWEYLNPFPLSNLTNLGLHENFSSQSLNLTNFKFKNTNKLPKHPPRTPRKILKWLKISRDLSDPRDLSDQRDHDKAYSNSRTVSIQI